MTIYYRRVTTWQKYPHNDIVDTDEVLFSTSKKKFDSNIILSIDPQISVEDRKSKVADVLGIALKKVQLQKI